MILFSKNGRWNEIVNPDIINNEWTIQIKMAINKIQIIFLEIKTLTYFVREEWEGFRAEICIGEFLK